MFVSGGVEHSLRTVRSWGADGPLANFKVVPETMFVSGGVEHLTADGLPWGADSLQGCNG